ncbi:MAG: CrcB family protein [Rhodoluna sp.]|nr:CrcB family protein [Rhodoluna sp.]
MNTLMLLCLLGGAGAVLRLVLGKWNGWLPWGILLANTIAATVATLALGSQVDVLVVSGLAGGLSTFSSLIGQTAELWANSRAKAVANLALNILVPSTVSLGLGLLAASLLK